MEKSDTGKSRRPAAHARGSDDNDRVALYIRLTRVFRERILSGEWPSGHRLPPIPALCREYDVAPITIRQALKPLAEDGWIVAARGKGTFVTGATCAACEDPALRAAISDPLLLGPEQSIRILGRKRRVMLPPELASDAALDDYVRIDKIHRHRGTPFALMSIYVAARAYDRFPKGADRHFKLFRLLRDHGGLQPVRGRQLTTICHADQQSAALLDYSLGGVLVRMRAWWFDSAEKVVFAGTFLYRGDMFVLDRIDDYPNLSLIPNVRAVAEAPRAGRPAGRGSGRGSGSGAKRPRPVA